MILSRRARLPVVLLALLAALLLAPFASAAPQADSAILFIGDGMGPVHVDLAALVTPLDQPFALKQMPAVGSATTREAQGEITDSAAAATALATGRKTNGGMVGVSPDGTPMETILERCQKLGKSVGIITTDNLAGATPASFIAHIDDRDKGAEIAVQISHSKIPVLLGFWKGWFAPLSAGGKRTDGRDLTAEMQRAGYQPVYDRGPLFSSKSPRLLGMFDDDNGKPAPSLADLVSAALDRLAKNPKGFFLIVENARVDWMPGFPAGVLMQMRGTEQAVRTAMDVARRRGRTIVVVTGDHETGGLVIQDRSKVLTLRSVKATEEQMAGHVKEDRSNVKDVLGEDAGVTDLTDDEMKQLKEAKDVGEAIAKILSDRAGIAWTSNGDHTDTPVGVYAFGPGSEAFKGDMDNTDIPKRIARDLELGPFPK